MAKKKRRPQGEGQKKRLPAKPTRGDIGKLPDRRIMEQVMQQMVADLEEKSPAATPLGQAQDLMAQAFEEPDEERQVSLALEALAISPDCTDAHVLLADHAPSRKEALRLYEEGVAAGARALGPRAFQEDVGRFWSMLETRPYMRAREGLANMLWTLGRREEAVQHLQDMLRLNPHDNQGIRYNLASFLMFLDRDKDVVHLLEHYPNEGSAAWAYTRALLAFRQQGDTIPARQLLKIAKKTNKHVPAYLLGEKIPAAERPAYYGHGDEREALVYIGGFMVAWKSTAGAIAWLRTQQKTAKKKKVGPPPQGPVDAVKKWLCERLQQEEDVWQADLRLLPFWIQGSNETFRPWVVMVTSRTNDLVLEHQIHEEMPGAADVWDTLVQAMRHPAAGEPHRPTELQVRPHELWETLKPHLKEIGLALTLSKEVDHVEFVFKDMAEHLGGKPQTGLLDMPGITPEQAGSFYEAAAAFFLQAPWKKVGYEAAIKVSCGKYQSGPWYAVLMGQSGLTTGLAVYEDIGFLKRMWAATVSDEENARQTVGISVTFGEESTIPVPDLEAAQKYGWKVARPDAYPEVFHKDRGMTLRPPLAWELELMEGCLRSVPSFVIRRRQDDTTEETYTVPVARGELRMVLSWVGE